MSIGEDDRVASGPAAVRVLIVDDQHAFCVAARLVVEATDGFDVVGQANSAAEGLQMVDELLPDLVLMDVKFGDRAEMDGLQATRRIGQMYPRTLVVVLSTYEEYRTTALEAGAAAFIAKPDFDPPHLARAWEVV